jgi:hypothetical protein
MPHICINCRKHFFCAGCVDERTEKKICIGTGITSYLGAAGGVGGTVAVCQLSGAGLSSFAAVCGATAAGLCIGSALAAGSVCIACGVDGTLRSQTHFTPIHPSQPAPNNPLDSLNRMGPPRQAQMSDMSPPFERSQAPSPHQQQRLQPLAPSFPTQIPPSLPLQRPTHFTPRFSETNHRGQSLSRVMPPNSVHAFNQDINGSFQQHARSRSAPPIKRST